MRRAITTDTPRGVRLVDSYPTCIDNVLLLGFASSANPGRGEMRHLIEQVGMRGDDVQDYNGKRDSLSLSLFSHDGQDGQDAGCDSGNVEHFANGVRRRCASQVVTPCSQRVCSGCILDDAHLQPPDDARVLVNAPNCQEERVTSQSGRTAAAGPRRKLRMTRQNVVPTMSVAACGRAYFARQLESWGRTDAEQEASSRFDFW